MILSIVLPKEISDAKQCLVFQWLSGEISNEYFKEFIKGRLTIGNAEDLFYNIMEKRNRR